MCWLGVLDHEGDKGTLRERIFVVVDRDIFGKWLAGLYGTLLDSELVRYIHMSSYRAVCRILVLVVRSEHCKSITTLVSNFFSVLTKEERLLMTELKRKETFLPIVLINNELFQNCSQCCH